MSELADKISRFETAPYVYSYPPTRMYEPISGFSFDLPDFSQEVNLYIHIPFCKQKCTFCGYLTAIAKDGSTLQEEYVDTVAREIEMYREVLKDRVVKSVNFGGGTPSLLTVPQFERLMQALLRVNPGLLSTAREISIEATPESVEFDKFSAFKQLGLNRVSVGVESFVDSEIKSSKRHNLPIASARAIEILRRVGIPNICADLMYGLEGQTLRSFEESLRRLIALKPETIELYSTVVIPGTPLALSGRSTMSSMERFNCYNIGREMLLGAGYIHDCHLRFIRDGGGYLQQENVFAGQSLIGFGAGARTYGENMHYRNCFDSANGLGAIARYMAAIKLRKPAVETAAPLSLNEKMRRYVVYNLEHLNKSHFRAKFGLDAEEIFGGQFDELRALSLIFECEDVIHLDFAAYYYRDLIARQFFSEEVSRKELQYYARVASR